MACAPILDPPPPTTMIALYLTPRSWSILRGHIGRVLGSYLSRKTTLNGAPLGRQQLSSEIGDGCLEVTRLTLDTLSVDHVEVDD